MRSLFATALLMLCACGAGGLHDQTKDAGREPVSANPDGGIPTGNCQRDHVIIANETARLISQYNGTCTADSDCALVARSVPCSSFCDEAVPAAGASELRAEIVAYGESVCPLVTCNSAGLCPAFETAICHEGVCRRGFNDGGLAE